MTDLGYPGSFVVCEVREGVSGLRPGDRVAGAGYAVHAEYVSANLAELSTRPLARG